MVKALFSSSCEVSFRKPNEALSAFQLSRRVRPVIGSAALQIARCKHTSDSRPGAEGGTSTLTTFGSLHVGSTLRQELIHCTAHS